MGPVRVGIRQAVCIVSFLLCALIGRPAEAEDHRQSNADPEAVYDADELKSMLGQLDRRLERLAVSYRATGYDPDVYPSGYYLQRTVAASEPCLYFRSNAHGHARLDWHDDHRLMKVYVSADRWVSEQCFNRTFVASELSATEALPVELQSEFLLAATGLWPMHGRPVPRSKDGAMMLFDIARSAEYSTVRPYQEFVEERWCHVLEREGVEVLWIDTEHSGALMARRTHDVETSAVMQDLSFTGHIEVAPEIWFPKRIRNIQYDWRARDQAGRQRRVIDGTLEIETCAVNEQVPMELFTFHESPGMLELSGSAPPRQVSAGGQEHLETLIAWAKRRLSERPSTETGDQSPALISFGLVAFSAIWIALRAIATPLR